MQVREVPSVCCNRSRCFAATGDACTTAAGGTRRTVLRPLPSSPVPSYTVFHPRVRRWSTVRVGHQPYSVASRLIGHIPEDRRHPDTIEILYRKRIGEVMRRLRGERAVRIDYRHVIWSLVTKPGAFARYRYCCREELFPR